MRIVSFTSFPLEGDLSIYLRMLRLLTQIKEEINAVCFYGAAVRDQQTTEDSIRFIQ